MSNQGDARERAYNNYLIIAANPNSSKNDKDAAWGTYLVKLAADTGAQQASKKH